MTSEMIGFDRTLGDAYEMGVCKAIGDELERHYPGWMWMVSVPPKSGVALIRSGYIDLGDSFVIKLTRTYSASGLAKEAVRAGGELLERVGMPRSRYDHDREQAARNKDLRGFLVRQP